MIRELRLIVRTVLTRNRTTNLICILTLALGIGANTAMFSTLEAVLIRPLPYPDPDRLVIARTTFDDQVNWTSSAPDYFDYRDQNQVFEEFAALTGFTVNQTVTGAGEPEQVVNLFVSVNLFPALGILPAVGRWFNEGEGLDSGPPVAMVSHSYWQRRFGGSAEIVGRSLVIDGQAATVVGVMPGGFHFFYEADVWRPMRPGGPWASARRFHNWLLVGRLRPNTSLEQAQSQMDVVAAQLEAQYPDSNKNKGVLLTPLHAVLVENYQSGLLLLMAALGLVLLIACANVASLLLARGAGRRTELAVRVALGASRGRLISQLLTESLMLASLAGVVGVGLALWFQRLILEFVPLERTGVRELGTSPQVLGFAVLLSLATGLLFGIVPAFRGARGNVSEELKEGSRTGEAGTGSRFRSGLVTAQVALSVVLLVGAGLLIRSFALLTDVDPGFQPGNLLTAEIRLPQTRYPSGVERIQFFSLLLEDLRSMPGVFSAAVVSRLPFRDFGGNIAVYAEGNPPVDLADARLAYRRVVLPGYFDSMGIPLLAGRDVNEFDTAERSFVLVANQTMAETLFPGQNPLGRRVIVDLGEPVACEVIGVVGDVRLQGLQGDVEMAMYFPYYQQATTRMQVVLRSGGDPMQLASLLRQAVWKLDRDIPVVQIATMEAAISRSLSSQRVIAVSLALFAVFALFQAAVGLYGVLSGYVSQRRYEMGIRMALGARPGHILNLVLGRGALLVGLGLMAGLSAAVASSRLLQSLLFGVESTDLPTFAGVSLFFGLVALAACLIPAFRATRVDPATSLRAQ